MTFREWKVERAEPYQCKLYVAGNVWHIELICRKYVELGLCVTITPTKYIYTGGAEDGAIIGFINYARLPNTKENIIEIAVELGKQIIEQTGQLSFTVIDNENNCYFSRFDK